MKWLISRYPMTILCAMGLMIGLFLALAWDAWAYEVTKKVWIYQQGSPTEDELKITANAGTTPYSDEFYWGRNESQGYRRINGPGIVIQNSAEQGKWKYYEILDLYEKKR